jgi:hypothetical protein
LQDWVPQLPQPCDAPGVHVGFEAHEHGPQEPSVSDELPAIHVWVPYVLHASVAPTVQTPTGETPPASSSSGETEGDTQSRNEKCVAKAPPRRPSMVGMCRQAIALRSLMELTQPGGWNPPSVLLEGTFAGMRARWTMLASTSIPP